MHCLGGRQVRPEQPNKSKRGQPSLAEPFTDAGLASTSLLSRCERAALPERLASDRLGASQPKLSQVSPSAVALLLDEC